MLIQRSHLLTVESFSTVLIPKPTKRHYGWPGISTSQPHNLGYISKLPSHLFLSLPSGIYQTSFPTKIRHSYSLCSYNMCRPSLAWVPHIKCLV